MHYFRGIFSGIIVWLCISISFFVLEHIPPVLKNSFLTQAAIVMVLTVFYAFTAAGFYYKKRYKTNGLRLGIAISGTALLLDVLITVPFIEIPNGRSYGSFFSSPVLWFLALISTFSVYFYWRKKVR